MNSEEATSQPKIGRDFFVSYNRADRAWAEWIAWQLEEAGYSTVLQAWDFRPGANFAPEMHRATQLAQRTLAVLSQDYVQSLFVQPEWAAAFVQDPTGEHGTLVPVRVSAVELDGLLRPIVYIDLVGRDELSARESLLRGVSGARGRPSAAPPFPDKAVPVSTKTFPGAVNTAATPSPAARLVQSQQAERTAVVLTALEIEYHAVRAHLSDLTEERHQRGTVFERGTFIGDDGTTWSVGIVEIGAGNEGAAAEAERAIEHFQPSVALFVGIAGGIKDVALGDVVAVTKAYGYHAGKANETFEPRPDVGQSSYDMVQRARAEARKQDWLRRLGNTARPVPRVVVAPIAAGEQVVTSTRSAAYQSLRSNYGDAVAVEMEGHGFLRAVYANQQISALIVRGISDQIDDKADRDAAGWQKAAARHASAFAFEVLARLGAGPPPHP